MHFSIHMLYIISLETGMSLGVQPIIFMHSAVFVIYFFVLVHVFILELLCVCVFYVTHFSFVTFTLMCYWEVSRAHMSKIQPGSWIRPTDHLIVPRNILTGWTKSIV